jgi:hypothetical protein
MAHVCRVCEQTFANSRKTPTFCTALLDIKELEKQCVEVELNLRDSFNAFCFTCRHISMSVPTCVSTDEQICYLQSQVQCFQQLKAYGLVIEEY